MHADIQYSEELRKYVAKDHASQNGTFLNGQRLAQVKLAIILVNNSNKMHILSLIYKNYKTMVN